MFRHCILCFPILCYSFFPIYWAYLYVLYSCFRFYQDSPPPFSANPASERCLGWIIIKQPNNSSESLCPNDAIEIKLNDLFVTHAELQWGGGISASQTSSSWLYINSKKSGYEENDSGLTACVSACLHQWPGHTQAFSLCCISCYCNDTGDVTKQACGSHPRCEG